MKSVEVSVRKFLDPTNILLSFLIAIACALFIIASTATFQLDNYASLILTSIMIGFYTIIVIFLLSPEKIQRIYEREINDAIPKQVQPVINPVVRTIVRTVEGPTVIKKVVRTVHKPVIRKVQVPIFLEKPKQIKAPVHKETYDYVGSTLAQVYHKKSCRFSKLIKHKYQIKENDKKYFTLRGYKRCEYCKP
jgi:hypothetical protein